MVSAIANGGHIVTPWVVEALDGQPMRPPSSRSLGWAPLTFAALRQGMWAVINAPDGTGIGAHSDRVRIVGKTGTAQTHVPGQTHGWFVGFCPADEPVAAMAIVAEFGGSGGGLPAHIAKLVCEYLLVPSSA